MTTPDAATPTTLEYATPAAPKPMSRVAAKGVAWASIMPGVVGLLLLALYRSTADDRVILLGVAGAVVGGLTAAGMLCTAFINLIRALVRRPADRPIARLYAIALPGGVLSFGIAYAGTSMAADWYMSPHEPLSVRNATMVPLDGVTIHFGSGDISTGPLRPGETRALGTRWVLNHGSLEISVRAGGKVRRKVDRTDTDLGVGKGPAKRKPVEIVVEPAELPKATP